MFYFFLPEIFPAIVGSGYSTSETQSSFDLETILSHIEIGTGKQLNYTARDVKLLN